MYAVTTILTLFEIVEILIISNSAKLCNDIINYYFNKSCKGFEVIQ